ncbi:MAG: hypothetical protein O6949_05425 [Chloroflexi bacterium]|nr:hypothetical protein [Chloroflexota bacterium]
MNCWTAEAMSTYAVASTEARWKTMAPSLATRSAYGIDLRRDHPPLHCGRTYTKSL